MGSMYSASDFYPVRYRTSHVVHDPTSGAPEVVKSKDLALEEAVARWRTLPAISAPQIEAMDQHGVRELTAEEIQRAESKLLQMLQRQGHGPIVTMVSR